MQESRKIVSWVAMLLVLIASVAVMFHLLSSAQESLAAANSDVSIDSAEAALQFKQRFAAASRDSNDDFPTPAGWEKLAPVDPNLDFAKELQIISLHAKDKFPIPSGWQKITSAAPREAKENPEPSLPPLAPPPLVAELPAETMSAVVTEDISSSAVSVVSSESNKRFPTEQRVWTNYLGKLTVASVIDCNFDTGELLMESKGGILRTYQLTQLSDTDRDYLWSLAKAAE